MSFLFHFHIGIQLWKNGIKFHMGLLKLKVNDCLLYDVVGADASKGNNELISPISACVSKVQCLQ